MTTPETAEREYQAAESDFRAALSAALAQQPAPAEAVETAQKIVRDFFYNRSIMITTREKSELREIITEALSAALSTDSAKDGARE